jgi:hypothetical protein
MLSDVCSDFVSLVAEKKIPIAKAVRKLAKDVEHYAEPSWEYPLDKGGQIDALRRAIKWVISRPDDEEALLWLLVLADCVRDYYDSFRRFYMIEGDGSDIDKWLAWQLRQYELISENRCHWCGQPKTRPAGEYQLISSPNHNAAI